MKSSATGNPGSDSKTRRAYEQIKDDILDQRLLPRQQLVEAELAAEYGISKTPVREALVRLAREGLVEFSPFRGGRVRDFTAEDVREIYEVRELLEPFALKRAVPLMNDSDRQLLRTILKEARIAAESGNSRELSRLNRAFHDALVAKCGNSRVLEILAQQQDQVRVMSLRLWNVQATYLHEADQHEAILAAVESQNAHQAAELLQKHIAEFAQRYKDQWNR